MSAKHQCLNNHHVSVPRSSGSGEKFSSQLSDGSFFLEYPEVLAFYVCPVSSHSVRDVYSWQSALRFLLLHHHRHFKWHLPGITAIDNIVAAHVVPQPWFLSRRQQFHLHLWPLATGAKMTSYHESFWPPKPPQMVLGPLRVDTQFFDENCMAEPPGLPVNSTLLWASVWKNTACATNPHYPVQQGRVAERGGSRQEEKWLFNKITQDLIYWAK